MMPHALKRPKNPQLALADEILRTHLVVERLDRPRDNQRLNMGNQLAVLTLNTHWLGMDAVQKKAWLLGRLELPPPLAPLEVHGGLRAGEVHLARLMRQLVARDTWIPAALAARLVARAGEAFAPRFHSEATLSARNVWVSGEGQVRLEVSEAMLQPSAAASLLGNMAPEKAPDGTPDPPGDVFSLGVLLYTLLTGLKPVAGRSLGELLEAVKECEIEKPSDVADAPASLDAVVMRALHPRAERRFASPAEFGRALERWCGEQAAAGDLGAFVRNLVMA